MSGVKTDEDTKPSTRDQDDHIHLKVKDEDGIEATFRIKRSTKLKKLMIAYCNRRSIVLNATVFLFNGHRVLVEHTPHELQMKEGDVIDVVFHLTEEQRFHLDEIIARNIALEEERLRLEQLNIALEEEIIRLRKKKKKVDGIYLKVKRLVTEVITESSALKEELTRVKNDEKEEDVVFMKIGRLLVQRIGENRTLQEIAKRLWKDEGKDDEEDKEEHEDKDKDEDVVFKELGKIVSKLLDKSG